MRNIAKLVKREINKKSLKALNENETLSDFSDLTDEQLKSKIYEIHKELMRRDEERKKKEIENRIKVRKKFKTIDDLYKDDTGSNCGEGDFYINRDRRLAGILEFGPGEEAPVGWNGSWDFFGDSVGDIFEQFNAIEEASKYNVINKFKGEWDGSIVILYDMIDKETLEMYNNWKKNSLIRKQHLGDIEKRARIYFKNVFAEGADGRDNFYEKMHKAEHEINQSGLSTL
jgi:hypothetical protein